MTDPRCDACVNVIRTRTLGELKCIELADSVESDDPIASVPSALLVRPDFYCAAFAARVVQ